MKKVIILSIAGILIAAGIHKHDNPDKIIKQITDDRGLTSVIFIQDGKEWGLDYLTRYQVDSLTKALHN